MLNNACSRSGEKGKRKKGDQLFVDGRRRPRAPATISASTDRPAEFIERFTAMSDLKRSTSSASRGGDDNAPPTRSLAAGGSSSTQPTQHGAQGNQGQLQASQKGQASTAEPVDSLYGQLDKAGKVVQERLARDEKWVGVGDSLVGEPAHPLHGDSGCMRLTRTAGHALRQVLHPPTMSCRQHPPGRPSPRRAPSCYPTGSSKSMTVSLRDGGPNSHPETTLTGTNRSDALAVLDGVAARD